MKGKISLWNPGCQTPIATYPGSELISDDNETVVFKTSVGRRIMSKLRYTIEEGE